MGGVDIHMTSLFSCIVLGDLFSSSFLFLIFGMFDSVRNGFFLLLPPHSFMYGVSV